VTHLLLHILAGAAAGWLIWRIMPPWLRGK
jgi:hypothetical protein